MLIISVPMYVLLPVFIPLYLNFNSKVAKTKNKVTKAKRGKNYKYQMWTEYIIPGVDQTFYVLAE